MFEIREENTMSANSKIEWTDHTFNPWLGCTKVSPGCDNCYAETLTARFGSVEWGAGKPRTLTSPANWAKPRQWDKAAAAAGVRHKVFCASLADVFDNEVPQEWREALWRLIQQTPHLDWLLLTKRIGNAAKMLPGAWLENPLPNVWLGASIVNQEEANRDIPKLLNTPARIRFLSMEPLLGAVDLEYPVELYPNGAPYCCSGMECGCQGKPAEPPLFWGINWVIVGGESGVNARPMHPDWARQLRNQCVAARVPFLFKQWGEWAPHKPVAGGDLGGDMRKGNVRIVHPTGQTDVEVFSATGGHNTIPGSKYMARVGKKAAGRLLDGREWNEFPK